MKDALKHLLEIEIARLNDRIKLINQLDDDKLVSLRDGKLLTLVDGKLVVLDDGSKDVSKEVYMKRIISTRNKLVKDYREIQKDN